MTSYLIIGVSILKIMDNFEYNSPPSEFQISTASVFISENVTTMNPLHVQEIDKESESGTNVLDGMYVFYGLGGILIFFAVYMICYSYVIHLKEKAVAHEMELRRLNRRDSLPTYRRPPMNEGRVFVEDFEMPVNPNKVLPGQATRGRDADEHENIDIEQGQNQESRSIGDLHIPFCTPQQIVERKYFPEDFQDLLCANTTPKQAAGSSRFESKTDNHDLTLGWLSTPPLCYSSPQESQERMFYSDDFQNLYQSTEQIENGESMKNGKSQECSAAATPSKTNVGQPTSPEGQSRSSPTSPDILRRRLNTTEDTPRRPSSWR